MNSFKFTGSKVALVGYKWFSGLQFHKHLRVVQLSKLLRFYLLCSFYRGGKEVQRRLEFWQSRLHEIEERYKELSEESTDGSFARGKQRGKKRQKVANTDLFGLSDYAAEVVYEF